MTSSALIFSDLHLPNHQSEDYELFIKILKNAEVRDDISEIWFVGDIFDLLVGEQEFWVAMHPEFWQGVERLAKRGKKILYFEGNHDFAFKKIAHRHGVQAFSEGRCVLFQGRRVFLSHGDEVDEDNETYARWRKFTKSSRVREIYRRLPRFITQKFILPFAESYSGHRKRRRNPGHFENETMEYRAKYRNFAETVIRERSYHAVFLGHSHIKDLTGFGGISFYCNLGSWLAEEKPYALWDPENDDKPRLLDARQDNLT